MYDVMGLADNPRIVAHLEQFMDAPSDEDVRAFWKRLLGKRL